MGKWRRKVSLPRRWQRNHLLEKYGANCYICHLPFESAKDITFDHWQPLSKGGADDIDNYRLVHSKCNNLKDNLTPQEFAEFQLGNIRWEDI